MKFLPSLKQKEILREFAVGDWPMLAILEGAVRSGKTWCNNALFVTEVLNNQGCGWHYIITGHTMGSVKRNVVDPMSELLGQTLRVDTFGTFGLFGNQMHVFGADKADSYKAMTGMTARGWYANEATLHHENTIQEAFSRVSGEGARIFWDTNPDYPEHPVKLQHIDHSGERLPSGRLRVRSWHFDLDDNPTLPADYIANLKASTPPGMWYDRRIKGLWVAAEGLVYELFDRAVHVVKPFTPPAGWLRVRAVDFGFTNPFVCLFGAVDYDGRLYVYDEHYQAGTLIKDHAAAIHKRGAAAWTVADHDAQERAELAECGVPTRAADKDVSLGIQRVAERMVVLPDGYPRLFIGANCTNLLRELGQYAWEERKDGKAVKEEPRKTNDHAVDALRYLTMALDSGYSGVANIAAGDLGL